MNLQQDTISLNDEIALTIESYEALPVDYRKSIYKIWLFTQGVSSAGTYVNAYTNEIKNAHNLYLFDFTNSKELLRILPEEKLNILNDKKRTSNCKSIYRKYRTFLDILSRGTINVNSDSIKTTIHSVSNNKLKSTRKVKLDWELWDGPSDDELLVAAKIITKYAKFLHPDIVQAITEDNNKNRNKWIDKLREKNIDPKIYLWENSPCAFPGIRRYTGSKEVASHRGHTTISQEDIKDAVKLDDNDFPKHIWSFVFRGKPFQKKGPPSYSLAHLIDHKEHNNRILNEFDVEGSSLKHKLFGLHSCPTNTVYVPISFLKPTDHSNTLRQLFLQKAYSLYGKHCNAFPTWMKVKPIKDEKWHLENFEWGEPVGSLSHISSFIEYRNNLLEKIFSI